jgi:hypothetical protein
VGDGGPGWRLGAIILEDLQATQPEAFRLEILYNHHDDSAECREERTRLRNREKDSTNGDGAGVSG